MNIKRRRYFKTGIVLLALTALLVGQAPSLAALATRQQPPGWVRQGYGDFPRLLIAAPGVDGSTLALYLVVDDGATPVVQFDGLRAGHDSIVPQFSPDGKRIAARLYESWDGDSALETVDIESGIEDARRVVVDQGAGDLSSERGAAFEEITGLAWLDDEHVVYSKRTTPSTAEFYAHWEEGIPLPVRGEVWLADLGGERQQLLGQAPVQQVLGASADGQRVYFTCDPVRDQEGLDREELDKNEGGG
jgi:hypothetical protein